MDSRGHLEKFLGRGYTFADLFHLEPVPERKSVEMEGFGEKSYQNLADGIEKSRKDCPPSDLGVGIANIRPLHRSNDLS